MNPAFRAPPTPLLLLLALVVGIVTAMGERLIFALASGQSIDLDEIDVLAVNAGLTATPFVYLAFRPRLLSWLLAILATAAINGWWLAKGVAYQMNHEGGGVDIGGAVLMLFAPFAILLLVWILNMAISRRQIAD
jgi:hypothetical protein